MTRKSRGLVVAGVVLAVTAVVAGAVRSADPGSPDRAGGSSMGRYHAQELRWVRCGEHECARLEVPLDHHRPDGDSIELAVERAPATVERTRVLVVDPGGPGWPGTDLVAQVAGTLRRDITAHTDVVGFDVRGTGGSTPVECVPDEVLAGQLSGTRAGPTSEFWGGCTQRSADLLPHLGTVANARDLDVLRAALGVDQVDYLGFSYGTLLGATYAELFPGRVGRFVLDGALDPEQGRLERELLRARAYEHELRAFLRRCVRTFSCLLGDSVREARGSITRLLRRLERRPLPAGGSRVLTLADAVGAITAGLTWPQRWATLELDLGEAVLDGDGRALRALAFADVGLGHGAADEGRGSAAEARRVLDCVDDPWSVPDHFVPDYFDEFRAASPTLGWPLAYGLTLCHGIPDRAAHPLPAIDASGAAPILVLVTTGDPATPPDAGVALAERLERGVLVVREGHGHGAYGAGNPCIDDLVADFLRDGTAPENGTRC